MITFDAVWIPIGLTVIILALAMRPVGDDHLGAERFMRLLWTIPLLLVWLVYALAKLWGRG